MQNVSIPKDKKERIIKAAMACFARNGYRKATMDEIVAAAGISKGLIFHYFGNKQGLYRYLVKYTVELIRQEAGNSVDYGESDLFLRIEKAMEQKIRILRRYPHIFDFILSLKRESNAEAKVEMRMDSAEDLDFRIDGYASNIDREKFRADIAPQMALRIIIWTTNGFLTDLQGDYDVDTVCEKLADILNVLKQSFYKEEFL